MEPHDRTELDRVVATLEALRPEEFVTARDELARRLRAQGARVTADRVARLRRPTLSVWAANEVARARPELTGRLLTLGEELEAAQQAVTSGTPSAARQLQRLLATERHELDGAVEAGRALLRDAGYQASVPVLERLRASLHAAAVSPAGREALAGGRLTQDLRVSGLGVDAGVPAPRPPTARPREPAEPADAAPVPPAPEAPPPSEAQPAASARQAAEAALAIARAAEDRAAAHAQRTQRLAEESAAVAQAAAAQARMLRETADHLARAAAELTRRAEAAEEATAEATRQAEALAGTANDAAEQARTAAEDHERAKEAHRQAAEQVESAQHAE